FQFTVSIVSRLFFAGNGWKMEMPKGLYGRGAPRLSVAGVHYNMQSLHETTHEQKTIDAGRRLRRRLRNHGAISNPSGRGAYGACRVPEQEIRPDRCDRHPRFPGRTDIQ